MKTSEILDLLPALESLDSYTVLTAQGEPVMTPFLFPSKLRFNLARNIRTANKVKHDLEKARQGIFKKYAGEDGKMPDDKKEEATREYAALLSAENDARILSLPKDELVQDAIPVPASVIAILMPIIETAAPEVES